MRVQVDRVRSSLMTTACPVNLRKALGCVVNCVTPDVIDETLVTGCLYRGGVECMFETVAVAADKSDGCR